jgi:hypothetical protein
VGADILQYLREQLKHLEISDCDKKINLLAQKSGAFFLFAATAVRFISPKTQDVDSEERLDIILASSMSEEENTEVIDQVYTTILLSVFHTALTKREIF